jgi:CMP-N-acetylneuraminic acid synthetase
MVSFAEVDVVALIQCTSPFLKASFLAEAYSKMMDGGYDSVFSVTREYKLRWKELSGAVFSNLVKIFPPVFLPFLADQCCCTCMQHFLQLRT